MHKRLFTFLLLVCLLVGCVTPVLAASPKIVDEADLLTSSEEMILEEKIQALISKYQIDIVIVTVDSLNGKSRQAYANNYYDDNFYGIGEDDSGILLLIAMDSREWYISTCGKAKIAIAESDTYDIFDAISSDLADNDFYFAFDDYLDELDFYLGYYTDHPDSFTSSGSGTRFRLTFSKAAIALLIGGAVAAIVLFIMSRNMNTARAQSNAGDYLTQGSYKLHVQRDMFLYSNVSKRRKPENNSSGRSGGGSSGGGRHGGGGGHF